MLKGEQAGFTMIEVILFLAVSSMLLVIALMYSGNAIRNARFSDATRSTESFLQEQFTRVQTNSFAISALQDKKPICSATADIFTNTNIDTARGSSNCLLLGLALDFDPDGGTTITVRPILGVDGVNTPSTATSQDALVATNPQVWTAGGEEIYTLPWLSMFSSADALTYPTGSQTSITRILFVRGIRSGVIDVYVGSSFATAKDIIADPDPGTRNVPTLLCIKSDDMGDLRGALQIAGKGDSQGANISSITSNIGSTSESFFAGVYMSNPAGVSGS